MSNSRPEASFAGEYDFVIVGGGSAGCVLANRLSADPDARVLLVEAGGWDHDMMLRVPLGWGRIAAKGLYDWGYRSEAEAGLGGRSIECTRGKVIGGCSSINAMAYVRGHPSDFDRWASTGLDGWAFADLLPYFIRQENWAEEPHPSRGASGPLKTRRSPYQDPLVEACMKASVTAGHPRTEDYNAGPQDGVSRLQQTIGAGRRSSASAAYLHPVLDRPNLTVETGAFARRILLSEGQAEGIEFEQRGKRRRAMARREVILTAGVLHSPQLLMLSGVGDSAELRRHGIAPTAHVPGVGQNLQDHLWIGVEYERKGAGTFARDLRWDRIARYFLQARFFSTGPCTDMPSGWTGFLRTRPDLEAPDIQILFRASTLVQPYLPGASRPSDGFEFRIVMLRPHSRGEIGLQTSDPADRVRIRSNFLSDDRDIRALRDGIRLIRDIASQEALGPFVRSERTPGVNVTTDAELDAYIRANLATAHHPLGTCKMSAAIDTAGVVDSELRVRGVGRLRVADASVMPDMIGGNINAAVIAIAEKAADMIRAAPAQISVPRNISMTTANA